MELYLKVRLACANGMSGRQAARHFNISRETTHVTGGCLCGPIRYEADVFLKNGYICHCTICQKSTGQPAEITVLIKSGTLSSCK